MKGGYEFDGTTEIDQVDEDEIRKEVETIKRNNVSNIVVSGVFSPVNHSQETQVSLHIKVIKKPDNHLNRHLEHNLFQHLPFLF